MGNQAETRSLILQGLKEHWGNLDLSLNPDLTDIFASYQNAYFLVARVDKKIIGCGALCPSPDGQAEIKRMSIAQDYRRLGIGSLLLETLVNQARQIGIIKIILETTTTWNDIIRFYLHHGFKITHQENGNTFFYQDLIKG